MENYKIIYEILDYEKFYRRLEKIENNLNNKFPVKRLEPIGITKCGFNIEHFKIGNGPTHIVYMGGCHGNEIISVDYVTQLMQNIAEGLGEYENFDINEFTIDFIPCQNPEGFFTTTYALSYYMKNMNEEEIEKFSKSYYLAYKQDDTNIITINKIINSYCSTINNSFEKLLLQNAFWQQFRNKEIGINDIINFLYKINDSKALNSIKELVTNIWLEKLKIDYIIPKNKYHHEIFKDLSFDCIPEIDKKHKKLKNALEFLYKNSDFHIGTLANFFANSEGVNLNDNNEYYYQELNERIRNEGNVYANLRDNNLLKSIPGPIGTPNYDMKKQFTYAEENIALLNFLAKSEENNYAFFNCHGTGGLIFLYPFTTELDNTYKEERKFQFYINNRLATEYTKETGLIYEKYTGENKPYITQGHPNKMTGVGDVLRKKYIASFVLELSKAGGNPIAPYCDKEGNYKLTMIANFSANAKMLNTILELKHLYETTYTVIHNNGKVTYKIK